MATLLFSLSIFGMLPAVGGSAWGHSRSSIAQAAPARTPDRQRSLPQRRLHRNPEQKTLRRHKTRVLALRAMPTQAHPTRAERASSQPQAGLETLATLHENDAKPRGWFARLCKRLLGNGNLRAGLMGFSDGVASTFGLVVASVALMDPSMILLAGLGGMIAGASSMAAGEYASIHYDNAHERSHKTRLQKALAQRDGARAAQLLLEIGHDRDIPMQRLKVIAAHLAQNPKSLSRYAGELGLDHAAQPSPVSAASASFAAFLAGAAVPLSPLFFGVTGLPAILASATASTVALVVVGTKLAQMSGEFSSRSALRLVMAAGIGAALSFVVGTVISAWVPLPAGVDL